MDERLCPECGAEFLPHVAECPHCEVPTLGAGEAAAASGTAGAAAEPAPAIPDGTPVVGVERGALDWLQGMADFLAHHGVPSRILPEECADGSCRPACILGVRREDGEHAATLRASYLAAQVPDAYTDLGQVAADVCPACGAGVGALAAECPDCGLVLAPAVEGVDAAAD